METLFDLSEKEIKGFQSAVENNDVLEVDRRHFAVRLGLYFYTVKQYEKMRKYFELAYELGSDWAAYYLGQMYYRGCGVDKDIDKAIKFLERAFEQNFSDCYGLLIEVYDKKLQYGRLGNEQIDIISERKKVVEDMWGRISQFSI